MHAATERIVLRQRGFRSDQGLALRRQAPLRVGTVAPGKPKLRDQVREAIRTRHMSPRTEEAYVHWIRRYIFFHCKRHPAEMGPPEITAFLTDLAVRRRVSASTQNQALAALLFLYREVLGSDPGWLEGIVRAKRPQRLPVLLAPVVGPDGGKTLLR
jgi:hypothetical protein